MPEHVMEEINAVKLKCNLTNYDIGHKYGGMTLDNRMPTETATSPLFISS